MTDWFRDLHPVGQAALAGGFTWFVTALGAAIVLLFGRMSQRLLDTMLGFAAGVMIAASVWSLLLPSIALAEESESLPAAWIPAAVGVLLGAAFLRVADQFMPHLHLGQPESNREQQGRCRNSLATDNAAGAGDHAPQHPRGVGGRRRVRRAGERCGCRQWRNAGWCRDAGVRDGMEDAG